MQVQVDVREFIELLESFNPNADLTGVKAYLFDLVVLNTGGGSTAARSSNALASSYQDEPQPQGQAEDSFAYQDLSAAAIAAAPVIPVNEADGFEDEDDGPAPDEDLVAKAVGVPKAAGKKEFVPTQTKSPFKLSRDEKLAKRQDTVDFSKMTSKEAMEHLIAQSMPKKVNGQFVEEGIEGGAGGDFDLG